MRVFEGQVGEAVVKNFRAPPAWKALADAAFTAMPVHGPPNSPSDVIMEGPTSDPTQFPTPTPTEATLLGYIGESVGDVLESIF